MQIQDWCNLQVCTNQSAVTWLTTFSFPSSGQDACCNTTNGICSVIKNTQYVCFNQTDCASISRCNGINNTCPTPASKANGALCNSNTSTCVNGLCSGTQCAAKGLQDCQCSATQYQCNLCCVYPQIGGTCQSTFVLANVRIEVVCVRCLYVMSVSFPCIAEQGNTKWNTIHRGVLGSWEVM